MVLLKEYFEFGLIVGGGIYIALFVIAVWLGFFPSLKVLLFSFLGGFVCVIIGSMLPDLDAPRSPVHDTMLVFFGSIATLIVQKLSPSYFPLLLVPVISVWADRTYLPAHRGFVHTVGAAILFGLLLSGGLYLFIMKNSVVCLWGGFSLFLGHSLHLAKDGWIKF